MEVENLKIWSIIDLNSFLYFMKALHSIYNFFFFSSKKPTFFSDEKKKPFQRKLKTWITFSGKATHWLTFSKQFRFTRQKNALHKINGSAFKEINKFALTKRWSLDTFLILFSEASRTIDWYGRAVDPHFIHRPSVFHRGLMSTWLRISCVSYA